jgi:hypothetical protein
MARLSILAGKWHPAQAISSETGSTMSAEAGTRPFEPRTAMRIGG